jgi:hypothetical protein
MDSPAERSLDVAHARQFDFITLWTTLGPLIGVAIGALLTPFCTSRWQRKQWLLDGKKAEYRELLSVLARIAYMGSS